MKSLVILFLCMCSAAKSENTGPLMDAFDVKPGGKETVYEKEWDKYKCTFTYKAQGGTKEQWQFIFEKLDNGNMLQCTVSRGASSYLLFENFTMSLTGPKVHLEHYHAVSYMEQQLKESEVRMDKKKRTVYAVEGEFKNKLERVTIRAKVAKKRTEL